MNSTLSPTATEPNDPLAARAEDQLAQVTERLSNLMNSTLSPTATEPNDLLAARPEDQLARATEQSSNLEQNAARRPPAVAGRRPSRGRPGLRGLIGLLLATTIFAAAFVWQSPYGEAAKRVVVRWAPQLISTSSGLLERREFSAQPSPPGVQVAAAEAPHQPTSPAQIPSKPVAPTAASMSPELAQLLQTMARNLANVEQGIEQLKASHEQLVQMVSDNAKAVERLRAGQEEMARLFAKASEKTSENLRPKPLLPSPRPIAAPARKPVSMHPSP